jgi:general secretion pathway protein E/type IV pilus assembly protein PilB
MTTPAAAEDPLRRLAAQYGLETIDPAGVSVPPEVLALVPRSLAAQHGLLPLARRGRSLHVASSDPLATEGTDLLGHLLQLDIIPVLAPAEAIARAIDRCYGRAPVEPDAAPAIAPEPPPATTGDESADDAPIIKYVHALILEAIRRRASDIHLEPLARRFRVRYRIDGLLQEVDNPPQRLQPAILSRLKLMANISIAEKRLPQDGRIQLNAGGRALDLRVSSLPTAHGESIVMRILDQAGLRLGLAELGFLPDDRVGFEQLIAAPDGILLVTGPTGSGKTTTLYSCLHHLNQPDRKIITVEEPVEYQMSGINQVPVRAETGMTFAAALRAMLRQAPNIIMVGEIRDAETADIAINASLTGHLVFSTLHTNDAPGAVTRLVDIGVKPFLVATALRGVVAQRLIRRNCPECSRPHPPAAAELQALRIGAAEAAGANFRRGAGCAACQGTGYRGRLGIFEIMTVTALMREMIHRGAGGAQLRAQARADGMRSLREDGVRKIIAGLTTVEEVASITLGDLS